mgnify:FL=1
MNITLPSYITNYELSPIQKEEEANLYGLTFNNTNPCDYQILWGHKIYNSITPIKYGVMETGFFYNASFIDTIGNYQSLSLNTYQGYKAVLEFELNGRKSARDIIFNLPKNKQSKYNADYNETTITSWSGPILILQNPTDRSILSVTSTEN